MLQNLGLMLSILIIFSCVKSFSLLKTLLLLITISSIKLLRDMISLFLSLVKRIRNIDGPIKASSEKGKTRPGDHTTFNACIEFTIIVDDEENSKVARYFSRSGTIQLFGDINPICIIINYLTECDLPEFESVSL